MGDGKETEQAEFLVREGQGWVKGKGDGDKAMQKFKEAKNLTQAST
jgi:hypothetical protein